MNAILPQNILLVDKPSGITSFDCIRILRRTLGVRKMGPGPKVKLGHAGTLDPMATGLMIIGVAEGTKKMQEFLKLPKTYEADILLGVKTDTGDIEGKILESQDIEIAKYKNNKIEEVLMGMVGKLELPVPAYSAIKQGGEALYKKARRGEIVATPVKTMEITGCVFLSVTDSRFKVQDSRIEKGEGESYPVVQVRFNVASGTYVRSLAEELGRRLGVPATLAGLRRTSIGEFRVEDAQKINP